VASPRVDVLARVPIFVALERPDLVALAEQLGEHVGWRMLATMALRLAELQALSS
jgi:hypothetical protein